MRRIILGSVFCLWLSFAQAAPVYITFPSDVDWQVRKSAHFSALYPKGQDRLATRTLQAAERAHRILVPIFPEGPDHTWIVLGDWQDATNGYSLDLPFPHIVIYAVPPSAHDQLASLGDWLDSMVLHEYVHTRHLYPAHGLWKPMRFLFGSWVLPNAIQPQHFHEGMAVLFETEKAEGGRGNSPYFKMFQRMAVAEKKWGTSEFLSRDRMDGVASLWPQGSSPYFFGGVFHKDLLRRKGEKGITDLYVSYSSNWPGFYNGPLNEVYGKGHAEIWEEAFERTKKESEAEIAKIRKEGPARLRYLTQSKFRKWDVRVSPSRRFVAYRSSDPDKLSAFEVYEVKRRKVVRRVETPHGGAEGFCWGKNQGGDQWLFVRPTSDGDRSLFSVYRYDYTKDSMDRVSVDGTASVHVHQLDCNERSDRMLYYQEWGGKGKVVEAHFGDSLSAQVKRTWEIPEGSWVTSLIFGAPHWIALRNGPRTDLYRWDAESPTPKRVVSAPAHLFSLHATAKGHLLAVADFDGRLEPWRFLPSKKQFQKKLTLLGGINSIATRGEFAVMSSYRHGGFDIAIAKLKDGPIRKASNDDPKEASRETASISGAEDYSAWSTILPRMWVPNFLVVPNGMQIGVWVPAFDIAQKHEYQIFAGYDTRGKPFGDISYNYRFGGNYSLGAGAYFSPNYIQSTRSFFDVWGGNLGLSWTMFSLNWRLGPAYRKVEASGLGPSQKSVGVDAAVSKSFGFKYRADGIAPISGTSISLSHSHYLSLFGSTDSHFRSVFSIRQYWESFWLNNHVFMFQFQAGFAQGTALYNSFFEGGGELLFYLGRVSFLSRGFFPGRFLGREIATFNVEYLFPLFRVERGWGLTPLFLKVVHIGLVGDILTRATGLRHRNDRYTTSNDELFKKFYFSAGIELKTEWQIFHYLPAQFRVGLYHGFDPTGESLYLNFGLLAGL
ncbi:MAG: hypothetical protein KDD39_11775 [Bdellovibrionales bacterium]|nr:hypothetical protein [Bdellovibrionales bacterium]